MGMLRLRFVGNRKVDPTQPDFSYSVLIERARDHAFLDFAGFSPPAAAGQVPTPPARWAPTFGPRPVAPSLTLARMRDTVGIATLIDEVHWLDLDASGFVDDDYYVYFYGTVEREMQYVVLVPIFAGDDRSLSARLRSGFIYAAVNSSIAGLPGALGNAAVSGRANIAISLPVPTP